MKNSDEGKISLLKKLLAEHIGVDVGDIHDDDSLREDLHMNASDLSDFTQTLSDNGFDLQNLNLLDIESVQDLIDSLIHEEL